VGAAADAVDVVAAAEADGKSRVGKSQAPRSKRQDPREKLKIPNSSPKSSLGGLGLEAR